LGSSWWFLLWGAAQAGWRLVRHGPRATFENGLDPGLAYLVAILIMAVVAILYVAFPLGGSGFW
jgi:hypothetical protein